MSSLFALVSAALFAGNALCVRLALRGSTATTVTLTSIATNLGTLWVVAALSGSLADAVTSPALIFLLAGAFAPALARLTYYESIHLIGITRASTLSSTSPLFAAILAVPILGEHLSWRVAAGTVFVVTGLVLTLRGEHRGVPGRSWAGVLLALNSAVMASVSYMLRKIALRLLGEPALGSALTMTGALVALLPYVAIRSRQVPLRAERGSLVYLLGAGLLSTAGFIAYFFALDVGDVVRVTPLSNTTPLFAVALLWAFRQVEGVPVQAVVGVLVAVAGILFVVTG